MQNNEFEEKLKSLEHRITMLKQRIDFQKIGPEVDTARKLLYGLEKKYDTLQKNTNVFIAEATSVKKANTFSEEELSQKLGAIYWIFGSSYEEIFSYKKYRIEFLQILPNNKLDMGCLIRIQVHIYENDQPFLMEKVAIEFWKCWYNSTEVDDIGISCNDFNMKYNNFHWFQKIESTLAKTWNEYFETIPLIEAKHSGLLESHMTKYLKMTHFNKYKEMQNQSALFENHNSSSNNDMQYLSEQEKVTLKTIPDEALIVIKNFDSFNPKNQTPYAEYNELEVLVPIWSSHMKKSLLYALTSGTAYTIENGNIYIWYAPPKGYDGAGFYRLKRFVYLNCGNTVKYFLNGDEKLSNPL